MSEQIDDSISINVESRLEDLVHAAHVYDSHELFPLRRLIIDEAIALASGAALLSLYHRWWMFAACALAFPIFRVFIYASRWTQIKPVWKSKIGKGPFTVSFDAKGMVSRASDARAELPWSHFEKMIESSRCILLVYCSRGYVTIPKSAFADAAELETFRRLATSHIGVGR